MRRAGERLFNGFEAALVLLLLGLDAVRWPDGTPGAVLDAVPAGWGSLLALVLVTAAAARVMHGGWVGTVAAVFLGVLAAGCTIAFVPGALLSGLGHEPSGAPDTALRWLTAGTAFGVGLWLAKLLVLRRLASLARCRPDEFAPRLKGLLETQRRDLDRIADTVLVEDAHESRVVQITGRWGEGKSFLLSHLEGALQERAKKKATEDGKRRAVPAVSRLDVWKHEGEPDLHLAIVEQVLSHPEHSRDLGWLRFPLWLLTGSVLRDLRLELSARLGRQGRLALPVVLPRLLMQRPFERAVVRARKRGVHVVIVLDEIDRSTPSVAQAAMTLVRRALDLPGVTVLVIYVDAIIRYKAFNPLNKGMPDLHSTMLAVLYEDAVESQAEAVDQRLSGSPHLDLEGSLRRHYASLNPRRRARLDDRFSEKYLSTNPVVLRHPTRRDVGEVPFLFPSLWPLVAELLELSPGLTVDERKVQGGQLAEELRRWWADEPGQPAQVPSLRALEGALFKLLDAAAARREHLELALTMRELAAFVAAVLALETVRHGIAGVRGGRTIGDAQ